MTTVSKSAPKAQEPVAGVRKRDTEEAPTPTPENVATVKREDDRSDGSISMLVPDAVLAGEVIRTKYWIGTLENIRVQNVTVGGVNFARFSGLCAFDDKGKPSAPTQKGCYAMLSEDEVNATIQSVGRRVLRKMGTRGGRIFLVDSKRYRRDKKTDRPLGEFLYMVPADQMSGDSRESYPSPLVTPQE